ncbi:probable CCR4-associated factor 1 homolog 11 [Cicer arietinum]|uniref:Probable CCR4-associated factor 1 homolog 11 n=1 Tax=Cicer arietinum TaxID=3827 RepID=A0A1S2XLV2_CICAR|nr:probable CCR4-associated factor 1 homolog 11 [Cicer arietinum]
MSQLFINFLLPHFGTNNRYIWEFNFCDFDVERDLHNSNSINLLRRQGIDFERNVFHGVNSFYFGEMLLRSGLLFNESVVWVTFHSCYDFGYLVKILTRRNLPHRLEDFLNVLKFYFGNKIYDIKHMIRYCNGLYGGLEQVASTLKLSRAIGKCHQAGSDSLLTRQTFQRMVQLYFPTMNEIKKHAGILFGLEISV